MKQNKIKYAKPQFEIIRFEAADVLRTSEGNFKPNEPGINLPMDPANNP